MDGWMDGWTRDPLLKGNGEFSGWLSTCLCVCVLSAAPVDSKATDVCSRPPHTTQHTPHAEREREMRRDTSVCEWTMDGWMDGRV